MAGLWAGPEGYLRSHTLFLQVEDSNTPFLCSELHDMGWQVRDIAGGDKLVWSMPC